MRACPRCGTSNPIGAAACGACGALLDPRAQPAAPAGAFKQTMLGGVAPVSPQSVPGAASAAGLKQTMLGVAPASSQPVPGAAPAGGLKQTMLGVAPVPQSVPGAGQTRGSQPPARFAGTMIGMQSPLSAPAPAAPAPAAPAAPADARGFKQTMLGFAAAPGAAPETLPSPQAHSAARVAPPTQDMAGTMIHASPSPHGQMPAPAASPASVPGMPGPQRPMHQQTMLGVARPGIAPLHAGQGRPDPAPAPAVMPEIRRPLPEPEPEPLDVLPIPRRGGLPKGALALMAVSAALAVIAGIVAFLWESPRPIRAEVVLDDRGSEAIALTCDDCADGTTVSLGSSRGTFSARKASLALSKGLEIGRNEIAVDVKRPGMGRDEQVTLSVGVDYRVRGVLTPLTEDPPKVKVAVEAVPGATAIVDGHAVPLDAAGKGDYGIEVSRDLEGPADEIRPFERKLPYTITLPGGAAHRGDVVLRFGIVPLRVEAPGDGIVIEGETFMLSGRTLKDGRITVSGRPITVDAEGRFAQLMNVSSVGETTIVVRAEAKDHAPRLVRVKVKRVASLRDEAALFRQSATDQYSAIASADDKKGIPVALDGEVVESRMDGEVTRLLLEVKGGCPSAPCLAKIVYGGRFDARHGAAISAYGHVLGSVEGPRTGARIPEVAAQFLTPARRGR